MPWDFSFDLTQCRSNSHGAAAAEATKRNPRCARLATILRSDLGDSASRRATPTIRARLCFQRRRLQPNGSQLAIGPLLLATSGSHAGVGRLALHSRWRGYAGVVRCDRPVRIAPVDGKDVRTSHMRRWLPVDAEDRLRLAVADCVRWWIGTGARAVGVTQIWGCVRTRWEMPCIPDLVCLGLADWDARCRGDTGVRAGVVEWEFRLSRFAPGWSDCLVVWSVITLADFANGMALVISMYVRYCGWLPAW